MRYSWCYSVRWQKPSPSCPTPTHLLTLSFSHALPHPQPPRTCTHTFANVTDLCLLMQPGPGIYFWLPVSLAVRWVQHSRVVGGQAKWLMSGLNITREMVGGSGVPNLVEISSTHLTESFRCYSSSESFKAAHQGEQDSSHWSNGCRLLSYYYFF